MVPALGAEFVLLVPRAGGGMESDPFHTLQQIQINCQISSSLLQISFHPLSKSMKAYKANGYPLSNSTWRNTSCKTAHLSGAGDTGLGLKVKTPVKPGRAKALLSSY
uniref:Uncharacterized protein n=1 Tax=Kangiella spongicola TaxID=796379 RepID=A0A318CZD6_9GAMM